MIEVGVENYYPFYKALIDPVFIKLPYQIWYNIGHAAAQDCIFVFPFKKINRRFPPPEKQYSIRHIPRLFDNQLQFLS